MRNIIEIFWRFLMLGCLSFGGPAAHMGYFRTAFVDRLKWLDDNSYSNLIALSQFLPGPGSSQVGFAVGMHRGGLAGGIAAFLGFTLPSFVLMYLLVTTTVDSTNIYFAGAIQGLKLLAVVVVADAVLTMWAGFCKTGVTRSFALVTAAVLTFAPTTGMQMTTLLAAAIIGMFIGTNSEASEKTEGRIGWVSFILFVALFIGLPFAANLSPLTDIANDFYQAGSLVFGGGHVVLPLLQQSVGDTVGSDTFLTGYAAAQAVPGPMFTLATYLGGAVLPSNPLLGAGIATLAIFLPGFLLIIALKDAWQSMLANPKIQGAAMGINAAVVGLLIAALYDPVIKSGITMIEHILFAGVGIAALRLWKAPILVLVVGALFVGTALSVIAQ